MGNEAEEVECPQCGMKCRDFTPESEFIGWHGHCVRCEMDRERENDDA